MLDLAYVVVTASVTASVPVVVLADPGEGVHCCYGQVCLVMRVWGCLERLLKKQRARSTIARIVMVSGVEEGM